MSSIKKRAIRGSFWTLLGFGSGYVLRFSSNLILTRLLFPEAFGLMSLVQTFMTGMEMLSDIGVVPSIIQNKRGDDPVFLDTAWTIQSIRGFVLWVCACVIAFPAAQFYQEPMLVQLLPVAGITSLIGGLNSTKLASANRHLRLGRVTLIELGSYISGLIVMIICAWVYKSVWALLIGGIVSTLIKMMSSHFLLEGKCNRFYWDQESLAALSRFGRWIFVSTVLGFLASQGDRLLLGRLLDVRFLGIYTIALTISSLAQATIQEISNKVLFAAYSEVIRDAPERLYSILRKNRLILATVGIGFSLIFVLFGEKLIEALYDDRYLEAGWILQVLALRMVISSLNLTYGDVLLAQGKAFVITGLIAVKVFILFLAMFVGFQMGGVHGVIVGVVAAEWLMYPIEAICFSKCSIWQPEVDLPFIGIGLLMGAYVYFV
jgi:O-antigen/teichoic acid export membrane protein